MVTVNKHLGRYEVPTDTKGGVCVDIGANGGMFFTTYAAHFSRIYFYEPLKEAFEVASQRAKAYPHIEGFNVAVSKETGDTVTLFIHNNNDAGSTSVGTDKNTRLESDWQKGEHQTAKTVSIEDIITTAGGHIDYCKMDCETSEYDILMGKDLRQIKNIGIEMHCQLGKENWNDLIAHILKTHDCARNRNVGYSANHNLEFLFQRRE